MVKEEFKPFTRWLIKSGKTHTEIAHCCWCIEHGEISGIWGYLLEFFDSVGIVIDVQPFIEYDSEKYTEVSYWVPNVVQLGVVSDYEFSPSNARTEAQQEAIKKAFEILEDSQ